MIIAQSTRVAAANPVNKTTADPNLEWDNYPGRTPVAMGHWENPLCVGQTHVGATAANDAVINNTHLYDTVEGGPSLERDDNLGRPPVCRKKNPTYVGQTNV